LNLLWLLLLWRREDGRETLSAGAVSPGG
jgi:hypothetical protein